MTDQTQFNVAEAQRNLQASKQEIFNYVKFQLGENMTDVELEPVHYETAFQATVSRYRQRSSNSVEESFSFLELVENQQIYQLPKEIISVRAISRRQIGMQGGTGAQYDPFSAGFANMYMMVPGGGGSGNLATYYLYNTYLKELARMFGGYINYKFNNANKQLHIMHLPKAGETILLQTFNYKSDQSLLADIYSQPWIRDYTFALCMRSLGYARGKFSTVPGPGGGTSLNGDKLLTDSQAMIDKLEEELKQFMDNGMPYSFIIG